MPKQPYYIEIDTPAECRLCGHGRTYCIVKPDGSMHHTTFGDKEMAQAIADLANEAFKAGKKAQKNGNR